MTHGGHIAEEQGPISAILAALERAFALIAVLLRRIPETDARTHAILDRWFELREGEVHAGDRKAPYRIIMLIRFASRLAHRQRTQQGRFYKRRRHSSWILCMEGRTAAPRTRRLASRKRASIPFAPVNLAPP